MGNKTTDLTKKRASMERRGKAGWAALQAGDFLKAEQAYNQAVKLAQELSDPGASAVFLSYLGVARQAKGEVAQARADFSEAVRIAREHGLTQVEAHASLLLGEQERDTGHNDAAIHHFLEALDAAYHSNDTVGMEISFGNLGRLYLERGWAEQASEWFRHALEARAITPNRSSWLGSLGLAMAELGQLQDAVGYYVRAYDEAVGTGDIRTQAICKGSQGNAHFELGDLDKAVACYEEALALSELSDDGRRVGIWLGNIGNTCLKMGNVEKAAAYCNRAVELAKKFQDLQSQAAHLDSLGDCLLAKGEVSVALEKYQEALEISESIEDRQGERIYLSNIGRVHQRMGQLQPAFEFFQKAIDLFDEQRSSIKADDLKTSFANRGQELYRDMVNVCLSLDKRVEALEYVGRAKSRALLDLLSNSPIDISQLVQGDDESLAGLISKEAELRSQIAHFERLFWQGPPTNDGGYRGAVLSPDDSQKMHSEWREVVNQLRRRHPNYANLIAASTLNFQDIQALWLSANESGNDSRRLNRDTAILEFYWTDQYLMAASVWHRQVEPLVHFLTVSEELQSLENDLASFLEMSATEGWEVPLSLCKRLYKRLVEPILSGLPAHIERLLIAPHASLYHLPFAALHDGERFLCQRFSISYLPTTSLIPVLSKGRVQSEEAPSYLISAISDYSATRKEGLVLSSRLRSAAGLDDLSYTMEEAETIFDLGTQSSPDSKLLTNAEVKEALPQLFSSYPVVHFAGHAVFNPDEPLASGLVLADGSILSAASILQANALRTECGKLLVLSACQTGVNMVTAGGEILGLARALMYAGMPNLVLSLWEVADRSTASLMQEFHKNIIDSTVNHGSFNISDALRRAQCSAAEAGQPIHAWAPFIHLGID